MVIQKNRYFRRSKLSEAKLRQILRYFAMDLTATDCARHQCRHREVAGLAPADCVAHPVSALCLLRQESNIERKKPKYPWAMLLVWSRCFPPSSLELDGSAFRYPQPSAAWPGTRITMKSTNTNPGTARDGGQVTLRAATLADAQIMFEWQSDDRTRKYARNPNKPHWEGHLAWVDRYLASSGHLFIIQHRGVDAGILRLDPEANGDHEVTVIIAPKFYRFGAAVPALQVARQQMTVGQFTAEVLPGNEASHRMLIEAGFEDLGGGHYTQQPFQR